MRSLVLALLATFVTLTAVAQSDPLRPAPQDKAFAKLRGITQFYIDVTTSENRPEDADLRTVTRKPSSPSLTANLAAPSARRTPRSTVRSSPAAANSCWRSSTA